MKLLKLSNLLTIFTIVFLFACSGSGEDDLPGDGNGDNSGGGGTPITSITITSDKTSMIEGQTVTFNVSANTGASVTSQSIISVDGTPITGNTYTPMTTGDLSVMAAYENLTSSAITIAVDPIELTSVIVSANTTAIFIGSDVTFTATARYNNGTSFDKTSESSFYVDNAVITGNEYTGANEGTVAVKATFSSMTSSDININIVDPANLPTSFTKNGVVEDFTGTWCGWCPRVTYAYSLVKAQTDKVFFVGVHTGDVMQNSFSSALDNAYGVNSYPTAYVNRTTLWSSPETNNVSQAVDAAQGTTDVGLAINSSLSGTALTIDIEAGFLDSKSDAKIVVFVLEDKVQANQENYTSYYGGVSTIVNYEHNGVLRYAATGIFGDPIQSTIGIHTKNYTVDLANYNVSDVQNVGIIVMLVEIDGRTIYNVQYAKINENKPFD
ncbi:MAG: Omp28-related outer membrane protein [Flavobacteriaceae bacterium]|nr:Omp28-related outer membrane protein [Flavobacteriaceae bacterium]